MSRLKVDGGVSKSDFTMQFQADLLGIPVERPRFTETTVLGAFFLAALGVGIYSNIEEISRSRTVDRVFEPSGYGPAMEEHYLLWKKAVKKAEGWLQ